MARHFRRGVTGLAAISTDLAAGLRGEEARLFVSSTAGALHAVRLSDAELEVVATAVPREGDSKAVF